MSCAVCGFGKFRNKWGPLCSHTQAHKYQFVPCENLDNNAKKVKTLFKSLEWHVHKTEFSERETFLGCSYLQRGQRERKVYFYFGCFLRTVCFSFQLGGTQFRF